MKEFPKQPKPAPYDDVIEPDKDDDGDRFLYSENLLWRFKPVFSAYEDNHEALDKLQEEGVVNAECDADSEMGEVFIEFKTRKAANEFIDRLNEYVAARYDRMRKAWKEWDAARRS